MDYSRREALALGGGAAGGLLVGGIVGVGTRHRNGETDGASGPGGTTETGITGSDGNGDGDGGAGTPRQYLVGTRDDEGEEDVCDAVAGEETVVDLGDQRTVVAGPLERSEARELVRSDEIDYVEPDYPVTAADAVTAAAVETPPETPWGVDRIRAPAPTRPGTAAPAHALPSSTAASAITRRSNPTSLTGLPSSTARGTVDGGGPTTPATGPPARASSAPPVTAAPSGASPRTRRSTR